MPGHTGPRCELHLHIPEVDLQACPGKHRQFQDRIGQCIMRCELSLARELASLRLLVLLPLSPIWESETNLAAYIYTKMRM